MFKILCSKGQKNLLQASLQEDFLDFSPAQKNMGKWL
mgnify:CR=1 FL=1